MDRKYFILIFFCGYLNKKVFSETEVITTEKQPQSTLFRSPVSQDLANSQTIQENYLSKPTQPNNISSEQPTAPTNVTAWQITAAAHASSGKPAAPASAGQPPTYNITRQPILMTNTSSRQSVLPAFTTAGQLPSSTQISTRQPATPFVYSSAQQPSPSAHTSSEKRIPPTVHNPFTKPTSNVKKSPVITPGFIPEPTSNKEATHKTNSNLTAAILIGVILASMLVAILMIVLWKCLRKPVSNDQTWAGRSPFADGETPDIYMDNIKETEVPVKRMSIVSLMTWKPGKNTVSADDLEIKLFESSENTEDSSNPKADKIKDQVNGTSEDSADGSTIGTAVSCSDNEDMPPFFDLEGEESKQPDKPTITTESPPSKDSTNHPPSLNCLNQTCEDPNSELQQSFPPSPDSLHLPPPPVDFMKTQEDSNTEIQCQEFSSLPDYDQNLNESLPLPPAELL
ncbi:PREDICTED: protein EVI2B [Chrysochloris asiatica]|uniref:Protein EVI2B n=1 Tax=Chrysochloris asiatica TaxID=185453 RepID=A0A9B0U1Q6_CHRAS|nr:PREDICTED: protein EVI2B [Chrysochloris asiatica]